MARWGKRNQAHTAGATALLVLCWLLTASSAATAGQTRFANGIRATIVSAEEILSHAKSLPGGGHEFRTPTGTLVLTGDPGVLVPFALGDVESALASMHDLGVGVDVTVYVLPALPAAGEGSFARRDAVYLAPGSGPVDAATVAYITTHEMGHVLTWAFMDRYPDRWTAYQQLRGLDPVNNGPTAVHAERAREILAEDIRCLFGGQDANRSNSIENHELRLPQLVAGLAELLTGFFATGDVGPAAAVATAFPNPCNPMTTIAMDVLPDGTADASRAVLQVFDLRGALVRTVMGGTLANNQVTVPWNGTTDGGRAAASGRYFYRLQVDTQVGRGSVTLVR